MQSLATNEYIDSLRQKPLLTPLHDYDGDLENNPDLARFVPSEDAEHNALVRDCEDLRRRLEASTTARVSGLRALSKLRRANEDIQNSFAALEKCAEATTELDLVLADEPHAPRLTIGLNGAIDGIAQVLPVSSAGISAIELFISDVRYGVGSRLRLYLVGREDHHVLDCWTLDPDKLEVGWNTFSLNRAITGASRTLELRIHLEGNAGLTFGLGAMQPVRLFQARVGENWSARPNGLALRIWAGSPDPSRTVWTNVISADDRSFVPGRFSSAALSPTLLAKVSLAKPGDTNMEFPAVSITANEATVGCHPSSHGVTIGQLPLPAGRKTIAVSADAIVANAEADPVEFALVLAQDLTTATKILETGFPPAAAEAFSGWIRATPDDGAVVIATSAQPVDRRTKLFFATRMETPGRSDFAWARLRNFTLRTVV